MLIGQSISLIYKNDNHPGWGEIPIFWTEIIAMLDVFPINYDQEHCERSGQQNKQGKYDCARTDCA